MLHVLQLTEMYEPFQRVHVLTTPTLSSVIDPSVDSVIWVSSLRYEGPPESPMVALELAPSPTRHLALHTSHNESIYMQEVEVYAMGRTLCHRCIEFVSPLLFVGHPQDAKTFVFLLKY